MHRKYYRHKVFLYFSEELFTTRLSLGECFDKKKTIPGTRSFCEFIHVDGNTVKMKYCGEEEVPCSVHNFTDICAPPEEIKLHDYVYCMYL